MNEEELLLKNLSFYEYLTLEQLLFDCDQKELENYPNLTKTRLFELLHQLESKGLIESRNHTSWRKVFPVRRESFLKRLFSYFKKH